MRRVYIFWDNSNIFIGARALYQRAGKPLPREARIDFKNLFHLATANRQVSAAYCVGSVPPQLRRVWERLERQTGVKLELYERGAGSNTEQALDQALQVHMLRAMADETEPQIAVLLTGDGAGYLDGVGFHADLERMHKKGWGIEVLSWELCCARAMQEWAANSGAFIRLEDYESNLIFEEGVTHVRPLDLRKRPMLK